MLAQDLIDEAGFDEEALARATRSANSQLNPWPQPRLGNLKSSMVCMYASITVVFESSWGSIDYSD